MDIQFSSFLIINNRDEIKSSNLSGESLLARANLVGRKPNQQIDWKVPALQACVNLFRNSSDNETGIYNVRDQTGVRHPIFLSRTEYATRTKKETLIRFTTFDMQCWGDSHVIFATKLYGLTRSESALAASMIIGRDLQDYADLRGAAIATVRKQLSTLYAKTRTNRQIELVSILRFGASEFDTLRSDISSDNIY